MGYARDDILLHVGPRAFDAGGVYQKQRRVLEFERDGGSISSKVQGNERRPYVQDIVVRRSASRKVKIVSDCSCPVGNACKHVAAALLEGLARASAPRASSEATAVAQNAANAPPSAPKLPPELASWLDALERAGCTEGEDYPPEQRKRIVYVFAPKHGRRAVPQLDLKVQSTRLLKNGALASPGSDFDPRGALNSSNPAQYLRPSDFRIFRGISQARGAFGVMESPFVSAAALDLIGEIVATDRARWLAVDGPVLAIGPARPGKIVWEIVDDAEMRPRLEIDEGLVALNAAPPVYVDSAAGLIGPVELGLAPKLAMTILDAPPTPLEHVALLAENIQGRLPQLSSLRPPATAPARIVAEPPQIVLRLVLGASRIEGLDRYRYYYDDDIIGPAGFARLIFRYGPIDIAHGEEKNKIVRMRDGELVEIRRDERAEKAAVALLRANGFTMAHNLRAQHGGSIDFQPRGSGEFAWYDALYRDVPRLREQGWTIAIDDDFPISLLDGAGDFSADIRESSGVDWLELDLGVVVDGEAIDLVEPIVALIGSKGFDPTAFDDPSGDGDAFYLQLPDKRMLALPRARLAPIVRAIYELACGGALGDKNGRLRLTPMDAGGLSLFEQATLNAGLVWRGGEKLRDMGRKLTAAGGLPPVDLPESFTAALRPYQTQGVRWLAFLREVGLGGVLADDMGLGKTVQALALIAIEKTAGRLASPALVIAPTSLMANWRREAEKFVPDLRVVILHGADRKKRFDDIDGADLVLSTYPLISRDHGTLAAREWSLLLLDEAQTIKNPNAATTKLIRALKAQSRFCLTGTPLENHLGELWSIFSFALPGFLGDLPSFAQAFRTPIEKKGDATRGRLLAARVRPFLLRRTKKEVANELPPKTEIVERVEMDAAQRDIYESIRLAMHERVRAAIAQKGFARSRIVILDALLKLRQCCCDPRLLKLSAKQKAAPGSAKLDRLSEILTELLDEDRRVLVFSQFTSMLDLIRPKLDEMGLPYSLLTGDTRDRPKAIADFQDGRTSVFLVSLKAGGVGLNLTAADTVVLYDPWWNPAVEDQAIDRAHRIGQEKPVFVHKLVAAGTIEEKMETLKEKKRALAESLFDPDGTPTLAMTEADLDMLFEAG
ncbi:MAG: serine/threonine protein phosphatase [Methylocystaceae bacterium]|nr:MAG: serine/threonine protein phosphatase [Methylocystaceae bacterium]